MVFKEILETSRLRSLSPLRTGSFGILSRKIRFPLDTENSETRKEIGAFFSFGASFTFFLARRSETFSSPEDARSIKISGLTRTSLFASIFLCKMSDRRLNLSSIASAEIKGSSVKPFRFPIYNWLSFNPLNMLKEIL